MNLNNTMINLTLVKQKIIQNYMYSISEIQLKKIALNLNFAKHNLENWYKE